MLKKKPPRGVTISIVFPKELMSWLKKKIQSSCRSLNKEVIFHITKAKEEESASK